MPFVAGYSGRGKSREHFCLPACRPSLGSSRLLNGAFPDSRVCVAGWRRRWGGSDVALPLVQFESVTPLKPALGGLRNALVRFL